MAVVQHKLFSLSIQSSSNTASDLVMWFWDFGNGDTSTAMNPTGVFSFADSGFVSLTVKTANGCSSTFLDTLLLNIVSPFAIDSMGICPGESGLFLNPKGDTTWSYQWSPAQSLSNAQVANPFASPTAHTIYTVTITSVSYNDTCQIIDSIEVIIADPITLNVESSVLYCDSVVRLSVSSPQPIVQFDWSNNAQPNLIIATGDSVQIVPSSFPFASYVVTATDQVWLSSFKGILVNK